MYEKLNKKARSLMLLTEVLLGLLVTLILLGVWMAAVELGEVKIPGFLVAAALLFCWAVSLLAPFVRYERYRYRITEEEIDVREGFCYVECRIVPIERLQKVAMVSGPFDRLFGLSKVVVTTAGGDVVIRFLENEKAEKIVEQLRDKINEAAVESRKQTEQNPFSME